jgi:hypothetical protein
VLFVVDLELKAGDSELVANVTGQLVGAIVFTECGAAGEPEPEVEPPPGEPGKRQSSGRMAASEGNCPIHASQHPAFSAEPQYKLAHRWLF